MAVEAWLKNNLPTPVRRALGRLKIRARLGWVPFESAVQSVAKPNASLDDLRSVWVNMPKPPGDPWSEEYRRHWLSVYETLSGAEYDLSREASKINVSDAVTRPFPYVTGDSAFVGEHMHAVAAVLQAVTLPEGSSILEMGAGWGNTSIALAQTGFDVTVLDIDHDFVELVRRRAANAGVPITVLQGDFFDVERIDRQFDAILFFESFHHCIDHAVLIDKIAAKLKPGGRLILAGEPVDNALPYDWGLNPNGEGVYQIVTKGWMELVFRERYLTETLRRKGFKVTKRDARSPAERVFICTR